MADFYSRYFTLAELTRSQTATRKHLRNDPNKNQIAALNSLCVNVLDPLRQTLACPVQINSGFRSLLLNWQIGGSATSQHTRGEAADLVVPGLELKAVLRAIVKSKLPFDQLIYEGSWIHVSHSLRGLQRGQLLQAHFQPGKVSYSPLEL